MLEVNPVVHINLLFIFAKGLTMLIYVLTMRSQGKWPIPDPDESPEETTSINATSSNSKLYSSINA